MAISWNPKSEVEYLKSAIFIFSAWVAELVDARDLKSLGA